MNTETWENFAWISFASLAQPTYDVENIYIFAIAFQAENTGSLYYILRQFIHCSKCWVANYDIKRKL